MDFSGRPTWTYMDFRWSPTGSLQGVYKEYMGVYMESTRTCGGVSSTEDLTVETPQKGKSMSESPS